MTLEKSRKKVVFSKNNYLLVFLRGRFSFAATMKLRSLTHNHPPFNCDTKFHFSMEGQQSPFSGGSTLVYVRATTDNRQRTNTISHKIKYNIS